MKPDQEIIRSASTIIRKADADLLIIDKLLIRRDLFTLLQDPERIRKAILLAINASRNLDPYYDPLMLQYDKTYELLEEIPLLIVTGNITFERETYFTIPKNPTETRYALVPNLIKYSLRYLLSLVIAERIPIGGNIFGGKEDIFELTEIDQYPEISNEFNRKQAALLRNDTYKYLVYVDIQKFYENIDSKILLENLISILQLSTNDPFVNVFKSTINGISLSYRSDHFLQNLFLHRLDTALGEYEWVYIRLTDDIRVFTKTEEDAKLAFGIIQSVLGELKLKINHDKCFVLNPVAELGTENDHGRFDILEGNKRAHIISVAELGNYPVENYFRICHNSMDPQVWAEYRYESENPKSFTYIDEVSGRLGFENENQIFSEFRSTPLPDEESFWRVIGLLHSARGNYRFQHDTLRTLILKAISLDEEEALDRLGCIYGFVDVDLKTNERTYTLYLFLRIWFIELEDNEDIFRLKQTDIRGKMLRGIFDLILKFISQYKTKDAYLNPVIHYIFKNDLLIHKNKETGQNSFNSPDIWLEYINRFQKEEPENWQYGKAGNIIEFFYEWFHEYKFILEKARYNYMKKSYKQAIKQFELIGEGVPILEPYFFEIAFSYADIDDSENGLKYYTKYLNTHTSAAAYNNRSLIYLDQKNYDRSLADLNRAIDIDPKILYLKNRAVTFAEKQDYFSAILDLNRIFSHDDFKASINFDVYRLRANYLMIRGDLNEGIESLKDFYNYGPDYNRYKMTDAIENLKMGVACKS